MRTPDFLIVGAAKSGTTSLARYLDQHDEISLVSERLEFFGEYENPAFKIQDQSDYLKLFEDIPVAVMAGEKSVSYLYSDLAPEQIFSLNSNMRIIIILRNPITRAYSDYWHRVRGGVEELSFSEALDEEPNRIQKGARFELHYATYGLYGKKVAAYQNRFGKENVLILNYDELKRNPGATCSKCHEFLGVSGVGGEANYPVHNKGGIEDSRFKIFLLKMAQNKTVRIIVNLVVPKGIKSKIVGGLIGSYQGKNYPDMDSEDYLRLREYYKGDVAYLSDISGVDFRYWLNERIL